MKTRTKAIIAITIMAILTTLVELLPAQTFVSAGIDPGMAVGLDKENGNMFNYQITTGHTFDQQVELAVFYEQAEALDFQAYGANINLVTPVTERFELMEGAEFIGIKRPDATYVAVGLNLIIKYYATRWLYFGYQVNYRWRADLEQDVISGWVNIGCRMNWRRE